MYCSVTICFQAFHFKCHYMLVYPVWWLSILNIYGFYHSSTCQHRLAAMYYLCNTDCALIVCIWIYIHLYKIQFYSFLYIPFTYVSMLPLKQHNL
jgi:hypothetical protein